MRASLIQAIALFKQRSTSISTDSSIKYTVKRGRSNLSQIGSLTLDCPNPDKLGKNDRAMEVTMDFSSTEIKVQAQALYLPGQPPVKAVLDFL